MDGTGKRQRGDSSRDARTAPGGLLERALDAEARFRAYVENAPLGIFVVDGTGRYVDWNPAALEMVGVGADELAAMTVGDLIVPEERAGALADFRSLLETGSVERDYAFVTRHGRPLSVRLRAVRLSPDRYMAFCQDVTARRRALEELQASEERYRSLVTGLHAAVVVHGPDTRILLANEQAAHLLGLGQDELRGRMAPDPAWHFVREDGTELPLAEYPVTRVLSTRAPVVNAVVGIDRPAAGDRVWVLVNAQPVRGDGGEIRQVVATFLDVTDRKRAEQQVLDREARLRAYFETPAVGIAITSPEKGWMEVNDRICEMLGYSRDELSRLTWLAITHPEDASADVAQFERLVAGEIDRYAIDKRFLRGDGSILWTSLSVSSVRRPDGAVEYFVALLQDIGERKRAERQLAQASRLAAMGTLVAGVAHEVNNPLAGCLSGESEAREVIARVRRSLESGDPLDRADAARALGEAEEALADAQESSQRIARIVRDLALFGRPDPRRVPVRLSAVVAEAMRWLPASVAGRATVEVVEQAAPPVRAAAGQLEQVVVNLVTNAAKATPEGARGRIRIRTGTTDAGLAFLEVEDHGSGIAPDVLDRIFEPFFTTRLPGQGMGLGLAVAHAIVASHGGTLRARSTPGQGSTFRMELPPAEAEEDVPSSPPRPGRTA